MQRQSHTLTHEISEVVDDNRSETAKLAGDDAAPADR